MGTVAKISLVYNRKFGFQTKFCMYVLGEGVFENFEPIEVNRGLLNLCSDCDDCIKNCPVNAIHENWIDSKKCDEFIAFVIMMRFHHTNGIGGIILENIVENLLKNK